MTGGARVVAVHVERPKGLPVSIDAKAYKRVADNALKPFRELEFDRPATRVEANMRKNAIRLGVLSFLNETGDLAETE